VTLILGIETSCDETAAAVVEDGVRVRSNVIASQHHLHERYLGVVPEIASRAHIERISPVIEQALSEAGVAFADIDAVAVGNRPGLIGSLLVGVAAAKAVAWSLGRPLVGVDHVKAHLYAGLMDAGRAEGRGPGAEGDINSAHPTSHIEHRTSNIANAFPALGLAVSGGHTSLYDMASPTDMTLLGRTIDDAVGEAYDKAAVILQLGYPGGPALDKLAQTGDPTAYDLPRSLLDRDSLDFSYSGLKTALLYAVRGHPVGRGAEARFERSADDLTDTQRRDLAAAFQAAAIDALIIKLERAIDRLTEQGRPPRTLLVGGGVSANSLLRKRAKALGESRGLDVRLPPMSLCLDNAAMIAGLGYECLQKGEADDLCLPAMATS
jgi:tRNA N6-adenosine threonylcarbamoyltransferase